MRNVCLISLIILCGCNVQTDVKQQSASSSQGVVGSSTVTTTNASPASSSPSVPAGPAEPSSFTRFMYVANKGDDTISQFGIDTSNGYLWDIGVNNRITTHSQPYMLFMDLAQKFLFCVNANALYIEVYSINQTTGLLTLVNSQNIGDYVLGYYWNGSTQLYLKRALNDGKVWNFNTSTGALTFNSESFSAISYQTAPINPLIGSSFTYSIQGTNNIELQKSGSDTGTGFSTGNNPAQFLIF